MVAAGVVRPQCYDANGGGGGVRRRISGEEDEVRDSEAMEKVIERGGSGMIIGELFCLFSLRKFPILIAPLSFSPLHG